MAYTLGMKIFLRRTTTVIVVLAILAFGGYVAMRHALHREVVDHSKDGLNYLRAAILQYAKDSVAKQRKPEYPENIEILIKENYLNQGDIQDCTHGMKVTYSPPLSDSPDSFILLEGTAKDFTLYCPLSGEISEAQPRKL